MNGRTDLGEYFGTEVDVIHHSRKGEIELFKGPFVASTSVHSSWARGEGCGHSEIRLNVTHITHPGPLCILYRPKLGHCD